MHKSIPQLPRNEILIPNTEVPQKAIEYVNSYIDSVYCENMSVDISFLNVIDACYVSTMCSVKHFTKYPDGKIHWKVSSDLVGEYTKHMSLGNSLYYI